MYKYKRFKLNGKCYDEHRIIMEIYLCRPLRSNEIVHHKNNDGRDNRLCNLELTTRSEHAKHHYRIGDIRLISKLTDPKIVEKLCRKYKQGATSHRKLAKEFGVPRSTVGYILRRANSVIGNMSDFESGVAGSIPAWPV